MTTKTEKILNVLGCEEFLVSMAFVESNEIAELNQKYRHKSGPTDVLSFPQFTKNESSNIATFVKERKKLGIPMLGDVIICPTIAMKNANEQKHTIEYELVFLIVHSILHLLGYDHENAIDAKRMRKKEREVLAAIEAATIS